MPQRSWKTVVNVAVVHNPVGGMYSSPFAGGEGKDT